MLLELIAIGHVSIFAEEITVSENCTIFLNEDCEITLGDSLEHVVSVLGLARVKDRQSIGSALYFDKSYLIVLTDWEYTVRAFNITLNKYDPVDDSTIPVDDLDLIEIREISLTSVTTDRMLIEELERNSIPYERRSYPDKEYFDFCLDNRTEVLVVFRKVGRNIIHQIVISRCD